MLEGSLLIINAYLLSCVSFSTSHYNSNKRYETRTEQKRKLVAFLSVFKNNLTLEEKNEDRMDHTKQQAYTTASERVNERTRERARNREK